MINIKYSEEQLRKFGEPASNTEEYKCDQMLKRIKKCIQDEFSGDEIEFIEQGSYKNNTNTKNRSDIDVCVMYKKVFRTKYDTKKNKEEYDKLYGYSASDFKFPEFKNKILKCLEKEFNDKIIIGKKSLKITPNSYTVDADVVPAFQLRNYKDSKTNDYIEGVSFNTSDTDERIENYPKQHTENGVNKNKNTNGYYKKFVRIIKKIKTNMKEENLLENEISSFVLECIIYKIPNKVYTYFFNESKYDNPYQKTLFFIINCLLDILKTNYSFKEINQINDLFDNDKKKKEYYIMFFEDMKKYLD